MAPTANGPPRRGRGMDNRTRRNAFTNAGVQRGQSSVTRGSYRARGAHHRRRADNYRDRDHGHDQVASRPSLASRITYSDAGTQDQTNRGGMNTLRQQRADDGDHLGISIRGHAASVNNYDPFQTEYNTTASGAAIMNNFNAEEDVDIDIDIDIDSDDMLFNSNTEQDTSFSQQSALFCGSQPTQPAELLPLLSPSPPPSPAHQTPTASPASTRTSSALPIHMVNQPLHDRSNSSASPNNVGPPKRPANTYRGKDPIKRLVQNKKPQAIFADRPVPKERTKSGHEKMELRMGMRSASK